jgi:hypothetical protein
MTPSSSEISQPANPSSIPKTSLLTTWKCAGTHPCQHRNAPKAHPKRNPKHKPNHQQCPKQPLLRPSRTQKNSLHSY